MSLSTTRSRRENAGSKMSSLLDIEERVDHFYDNIYGGFQEDDNDSDYNYDESDSEDSADSDISIDENEDLMTIDDQNDEELKPKPKIKTKFGLIGNKLKPIQTKLQLNRNQTEDKTEIRVPLEIDLPSMEPIVSSNVLRSVGKELSDQWIIEKRLKFFEEDLELDPNICYKKAKNSGKEWTQKELLEEAMVTEQINLRSLKNWQKSELERTRKQKEAKHSIDGPFIRYHSVSMPLIQELSDNTSDETSIEIEAERSGAKSYSRTFISFNGEHTYDSLLTSLSNNSLESPKQKMCPITKMPARYLDPISQLPFANIEAFKTIRTQYYHYSELYSKDNELKEWAEKNQKWKEWQQKYLSYDNSEPIAARNQLEVIKSLSIVPKQVPKRVPKRSGRKRKTN